MFNIGMPELILIFIVVLIALGPKRLPEVGRSIGKAVLLFKKASLDLKQALEQEAPDEIKEEVEEKLAKSQENKDNG